MLSIVDILTKKKHNEHARIFLKQREFANKLSIFVYRFFFVKYDATCFILKIKFQFQIRKIS